MGVELVTKSITVTKGAADFSKAIVDLVTTTQTALANGFQPGEDLAVIAGEALKDLPVAVANLSKLKEEAEYDKGKVILAVIAELDRIL